MEAMISCAGPLRRTAWPRQRMGTTGRSAPVSAVDIPDLLACIPIQTRRLIRRRGAGQLVFSGMRWPSSGACEQAYSRTTEKTLFVSALLLFRNDTESRLRR